MDIATHTIKSFGVPGSFPRFSPDGTQIAYLAGQTGGERVLNVMDADGTNAHQVSPPNYTYEDFAAVDWSTDGKWLVAVSHYSNPHPRNGHFIGQHRHGRYYRGSRNE